MAFAANRSNDAAPPQIQTGSEQAPPDTSFDLPALVLTSRDEGSSGDIEKLVATAEAAQDPLGRVDALLLAANWVLSRQVEAASTKALLMLSDPLDPAGEGRPLVVAFDRAEAFLDRVENALEEIQNPEDFPQQQLNNLAGRLANLRAFGTAQRAFLLANDESEGWVSPRRAASRLAPLLEVDDAQISAAAGLWQAALASRRDDPERALAALDLALSDPLDGTLPYAVFARWLRCRLIALRGGHIAAIALLVQLDRRIETWFSDRDHAANASRATALIQMQVLQMWHDRLDASTETEERAWCVSQVANLKKERFAGEATGLLRLHNAIPILPMMKKADPPTSNDSGNPDGGEPKVDETKTDEAKADDTDEPNTPPDPDGQ